MSTPSELDADIPPQEYPLKLPKAGLVESDAAGAAADPPAVGRVNQPEESPPLKLPSDAIVTLEPEEEEEPRRDALSPNRHHPPVLLILTTAALALLFVLYLISAVQAYAERLASTNVFFYWTYVVAMTVLGISLLLLLLAHSRRYRKLPPLDKMKARLAEIEQGRPMAPQQEDLLREQIQRWLAFLQSACVISDEDRQRVTKKFQDADALKHWIDGLRDEILPKLDDKAKTTIEKEARAVGAATALSPYGLIDAVVVLWRNGKLVLRVAEIYGARPGWWESLRLMRNVFGNVLFAGLSQEMQTALVGKLGAGWLTKLAGHAAGAATQGLATAAFTIRVGLSAQNSCRLLRMTEDETETQAGLFSALVNALTRRKRQELPETGPSAEPSATAIYEQNAERAKP